jgi:hypothetical protein
VIESQRKARSKITSRRTSLGPLRQGQRLDTSETKHSSSKECKPPKQSSNTTKSSPCTYASSPWAKAHSPWTNAAMQCGNATKSKNLLTLPRWLDRLCRAVRPPVPHLTAWGAVRPPQETDPAPNCSKFSRTNWNTFQTLPGARSKHKLLPLVDNAWIKAKCENFQHIASQIYKIHHKELHKSKWAS